MQSVSIYMIVNRKSSLKEAALNKFFKPFNLFVQSVCHSSKNLQAVVNSVILEVISRSAVCGYNNERISIQITLVASGPKNPPLPNLLPVSFFYLREV